MGVIITLFKAFRLGKNSHHKQIRLIISIKHNENFIQTQLAKKQAITCGSSYLCIKKPLHYFYGS